MQLLTPRNSQPGAGEEKWAKGFSFRTARFPHKFRVFSFSLHFLPYVSVLVLVPNVPWQELKSWDPFIPFLSLVALQIKPYCDNTWNKMIGHQRRSHLKSCNVTGSETAYGVCQTWCEFRLRNLWLKGYIWSKCSPLWSLAMFVEKPLLKHLELNSEQTKQLFFESLLKYVWQLLDIGECLSHFFEISLQSVIQPSRCNHSNLVARVGFAEFKNALKREFSGWK